MIFDVNAFIGKWPFWPVPDGVHPVDRAAVCSTRGVFVNCEDGNCEVQRASGNYARFACIGPPPHAEYDLAHYARRGFCGVRLYPQHHSYHPLYEPFVDIVLEQAAMIGWPVLLPLRIIMNWGMPMLDAGVIAALVERHPKVNWILAGVNYLHELQMAEAMMRRFPGVHLETSCIMGFEALRGLVERHGAERILFGSAAPMQHRGAGVEKILRAKISESAREAILGGNAERLCG